MFANFLHFGESYFAAENAEFCPLRLPEFYRLCRTDVGLRGDEQAEFRRMFPNIHENAGIGNQHAVRMQPAQSVDKLRQFGNIAVVHEQVQGQVDFFAVFMNEFNAFLKLFKREF